MGALISSNTLRLEPDSLSYQTARTQIPQAPQNANTMVFYYKAYVDTLGGAIEENGTSYGWNNDSYFGLSFNGSVSANQGGIVGFTNTDEGVVLRTLNLTNYSTYFFGKNSGFSQFVPFMLGTSGGFYNRFSYGHPTPTTVYSAATWASVVGATTNTIGLTGAQKYLGLIKIAKHGDNPQQVVISYGSNWQGLSADSFSTALTSLSTGWAFEQVALTETTNFRPNFANPSLSATINFPRWIVAKWPSAVVGRNFVVTDIKVEYYD